MTELQHSEKKRQRGIYLLPNLLTTAALFSGFYSIIASMNGRYETAAIAIFISMIADGLDGRVARLTNTQSAFGAQYDSLSDMAAFGVAPALLLFSWSLQSLGKGGSLIAFLFTAATALRLARFNIQQTDKEHFQGLPCPSAAGVMAALIWVFINYEIDPITFAAPIAVMTLLTASLMVSSIRYSSFKAIDFKGKVPFITIVVTVLILAAIALQPADMLLVLFMTYTLSGPLMTLWTIRKIRKLRTTQGLQRHSNHKKL